MKRCTVVYLLAVLTSGLSALVVRQDEATATITEAAASTVTSTSSDLLPFESVQLTESDLEPLNETLTSLFAFDDISSVSNLTARSKVQCKTFPGDALWPQEWIWDIFDILLGGALIKTVPIAAPCYPGKYYNAARCDVVVNNFTDSALHELDPASIMFPLWVGNTCPATTTPTKSCTIGGYPTYAVNISNVAQIQLAVNFARSANIRLVVKNTGHDFNGKSAGAGALSIWTHYLKGIQYIAKYSDKTLGYSGPAFKAGSGVIAKEIYAAAKAQGLTVVGGEGQTVGVMGGYIQGGGHSPLSSLYGIAADAILAMEVVTADGRFVTASPTTNTDLFWALRGGGGSTFGVVTSVTVRAFPKITATIVSFSFTTATMSTETFWAGVRTYFDYFLTFADKGTYSYFFVYPFGIYQFIMQPFFAPNMNTAQTKALLQPWFDRLAALGIVINPVYTTYDNYYDAWIAGFPLETVGRDGSITGSRLFQRSAFEDPKLLNATFEAWASSARDNGALLVGFNMAPKNILGVDNSVNPAWRTSVMHTIQGVNVNSTGTAAEQKATRALLTQLQTNWRTVSPCAGSYLGESDAEEPDFQTSFWGDNYARLLKIKQTVDPKNVFWVRTGVGSEVMKVQTADAIQDENGRLCNV